MKAAERARRMELYEIATIVRVAYHGKARDFEKVMNKLTKGMDRRDEVEVTSPAHVERLNTLLSGKR